MLCYVFLMLLTGLFGGLSHQKPSVFFVVCFFQIYIQTRNPANSNMLIVRNEYPDRPLTLEGALGKRKHYQQFQPVITLAKGYTIHWDQAAPAEVTIWLINFNKSVDT